MKINITRLCILLTVAWFAAVAVIVLPNINAQYRKSRAAELTREDRQHQAAQARLLNSMQKELDKMPKEKRDKLCEELFRKHSERTKGARGIWAMRAVPECNWLANWYGAVPLPKWVKFGEPKPLRKSDSRIFFETVSAKLAEHWMLLSLVLVIWLIPSALRYVTTNGKDGTQ